MIVHYQKRKNNELFEGLEKPDSLFLSKTQNYVPIYQRFFSLNATNYNNVNLNNKWYISNVNNCMDDNPNVFKCIIANNLTKKTKCVPVFFKLAPLLDPCKFLIGKHDLNDTTIFHLPDIESNESHTHSKLLDKNNSAYIDSFFVYLSSQLFHEHRFIHGLDFYGSFLSIKKNYKINIVDDLDYLSESEFFNKNKNVLFQVDEYDYLLESTNNDKLKPLTIHSNKSLNSIQSIHSIDNEIFDNIFNEGEKCTDSANLKEVDITLYNLEDINIDMTHLQLEESTMITTTLKSSSTCSSRTSHTFSVSSDNMCSFCQTDTHNQEHTCCDESIKTLCHEPENENGNDENNDNEDNDNDTDEEMDSHSSMDSIEEAVFVTFPKFPVQVICMENCEDTFDNLIIENDLTNEEWMSAFMQIIMILITYQKVFSLTHNDLHSNNVMYNTTNKKFIYYKYNQTYYKVPTFGRLFKIIDFGRAIYKFNNDLFCSDSFKIGGDAAGQYNIEPYLNSNKPRLEPNFSFDLCRLACSIFDYLIEDMNELPTITKDNVIAKLICEWCMDDNGINILYKNNGDERYPDFKLYKMIARCVHNHTPQAQLDREEFKQFSKFTFKKDSNQEIIDIDSIPCFF